MSLDLLPSLRDRLALSTGTGRLEDAFAFADGLGIRWLELACQEPANQPHTFDRVRVDGVRRLMRSTGIRGVVHTASSVNVAEIVPGVREAVEGYLRQYVELAHNLEVSTVIVHAGFQFDLDVPERISALQTTLGRCAEVAGRLGVTLAIENMNVLPAAAEITYLGCTPDEIGDILDAVDSPFLTACLDLGHAHLLPDGVGRFLDRVGGRIGHVQLTDNDGVVDDHLALGEGTIDVSAALTGLARVGYEGPVAIELASRADQLASLAHLGWQTSGR